ncbi:MAG: hypothetical protein J5716_01975 [Alphaproteobacteria bacterium]|nr:hypothetical protein [Alphaproteobacteria bacterium]
MRWIKKGLIFKANGEYGWIKSHAQVPKPLVLDDCIRVYFSPRNDENISCIAMMDLDRNNPKNILKIYDKPVLEHGEMGYFDEHGVMPQFVCKKNNQVYLFYAGWSRRDGIPYSNWTGLAISDDNGLTFKKAFDVPVLDRAQGEVYSATGLTVFEEGNLYYGFYANGTKWCDVNGKLESAYEIVAATSEDMIHWKRNPVPIFSKNDGNEANTAPTLAKINGVYHMWFCYRGVEDYRDGRNSYRIGYAYSKDLKTWIRDDSKSGFERSKDGWDSKMTPYPYVVKVDDRYLMFYNGNYFGKAGFGYAELEI